MAPKGQVAELFSDPEQFPDAMSRGAAFQQYRTKLNKAIADRDLGHNRWAGRGPMLKGAGAVDSLAEKIATITKSLSADDLASLQTELDAVKGMQADLAKDWTFAGPSSVQLVPYDLEAPAKELVPRFTPLRNILSRVKGQGSGRQFKRILGFTNAGVGGVPDLSPFMNSESVQTNFGSLALRRGQKISYSADQQTIPYEEMGFSDQVNFKAYFAGLGFQDVRELSQHALLWAHLIGEEKAILYGRGTASPFVGAQAAPTGVTATGAGTGGTIGAGTYYVKITAKTGFGESVTSAEVNTGALSGSTNKITIALTEPAGSLGVYNLYVGTASGAETFQTTFSGNGYVLTSYATGGAAAPSADSSGDANAWDGLLTAQANPANGASILRLNQLLGGTGYTTPGAEFQALFLSMWNLVFADPDEIWTTANVRNGLGNQLTSAGSSAYRITMENDGTGKVGSVVNGIVNQSSPNGKMVDLNVHPYMLPGNALVRSHTLPIPDSEVTETSQLVMVQDYMSVDWPQIQFTYDQSTYTFGTFVHYAPKWNGLITGIQN